MTMKGETYYTPLTPVNFLVRSAAVFPEKTAVVYKDTRFSYREFYERVNRLASALKKEGIEKGDRVAFLCPNLPPLLEAHFAVPLSGAILVAINIRLAAPEILYILNHSGAKMLFVDTAFAKLIEPIRDQLEATKKFVIIVDEEPTSPLEGPEYEEFLSRGSSEPIEVDIADENDTISINYTSGTTGQPKGVMYTHRGAYLNALGEALEMDMNAYSNYLWTLPMFHCNGWCFPWTITACAGTHVCLRKVDPEKILQLIRDVGVTHMCGAPIVLNAILNAPDASKQGINHEVKAMTAGAAPPAQVIGGVEEMGISVTHVYGLTEVYGPVMVCAWHDEWDEKPLEQRARLKARQGVRYPTLEGVMVADSETLEPVPQDGETMGEIFMRGNTVMKGYLKNPSATDKAFKGDWYHTGDLAVWHADGYVEIKDRLKDVIISGGENISTIEVEDTLYRHPAIMEVAVVARPDDKWGETPCAFVTLHPGQESVTEQDIIQFCRDNMATFKAPKTVVFCDLPKTSTGKIQKFRLRDQAKDL